MSPSDDRLPLLRGSIPHLDELSHRMTADLDPDILDTWLADAAWIRTRAESRADPLVAPEVSLKATLRFPLISVRRYRI